MSLFLKDLYDALEKENFTEAIDNIKSMLNSSKASGGVGCSPGQAHGGAYNGKDISKIISDHQKMFIGNGQTCIQTSDHPLRRQ